MLSDVRVKNLRTGVSEKCCSPRIKKILPLLLMRCKMLTPLSGGYETREAPLYRRTLWLYTNAVIIIIIRSGSYNCALPAAVLHR